MRQNVGKQKADNWQEFRTHGFSHQCSASELRPLDNYTSPHKRDTEFPQSHTQQLLRMCCQNYCKSDVLFDFQPLLAFYYFFFVTCHLKPPFPV